MSVAPSASYRDVFPAPRSVIGMVHLLPLPGSPGYSGDLDEVVERAVTDAQTLSGAGVDALLVENFHDYPFFPETAEPETVAAATVCAGAVSKACPLPVGVQILRNSWKASLGIAAVIGARFVRLNILTEAMVTDQGIINGVAHLAMRYKRAVMAEHVLVFADLNSKHAVPVSPRPLEVVAADMVNRGGADAIILSGDDTSTPPRAQDIEDVRAALPHAPIILGSGMTVRHADLARQADAIIFGYGSKPDADMRAPVSKELVTAFVEEVKG